MDITITCPMCGESYRKDASLSGKRGRCKICKHVFVMTPDNSAPSLGEDGAYVVAEEPTPISPPSSWDQPDPPIPPAPVAKPPGKRRRKAAPERALTLQAERQVLTLALGGGAFGMLLVLGALWMFRAGSTAAPGRSGRESGGCGGLEHSEGDTGCGEPGAAGPGARRSEDARRSLGSAGHALHRRSGGPLRAVRRTHPGQTKLGHRLHRTPGPCRNECSCDRWRDHAEYRGAIPLGGGTPARAPEGAPGLSGQAQRPGFPGRRNRFTRAGGRLRASVPQGRRCHGHRQPRAWRRDGAGKRHQSRGGQLEGEAEWPGFSPAWNCHQPRKLGRSRSRRHRFGAGCRDSQDHSPGRTGLLRAGRGPQQGDLRCGGSAAVFLQTQEHARRRRSSGYGSDRTDPDLDLRARRGSGSGLRLEGWRDLCL